MPLAVFESFSRINPGWTACFDRPVSVCQAKNLDEVIPILKRVDEAARNRKWAVVLISYEASPAFDPAIKAHSSGTFPLIWAAIFDHADTSPANSHPAFEQVEALAWEPLISPAAYVNAIDRIKDFIAKGDTYQVNYTFPLRTKFRGDTWSWYRQLGANQGAGYSAYLNLGAFQVLSFSPELFFERRGDRLVTRPMKGTLPRGRWFEEDTAQMERLRSTPKNRAENIMIVDMLRNDLGKVSVAGGVKVTDLCRVEPYETLLQMTSTIESIVPKNISLLELITALFPSGSVTGAPKIRTMEIIRDLEPDPRSIYTGTLGFVQPGGDCVFNVAIRTLWHEEKTGETRMGVG